MRRTITIASCLAMLCLVALVIWLYVTHSDIVPQNNAPDHQASNHSPDSTVQPAASTPVFDLPVRVAVLSDGEVSPCYADNQNKTLYRWKGVVLRPEQLPHAYTTPSCAINMLNAEDFSAVVPFEAQVKYREDKGRYRPGYLDHSARVFYEWKGVVLTKQEVLDKSQDRQAAIADPDRFSQVIEIDMPAHLKEHPELWKKT